ncbi:Probable catabolite repression protein creC [Galdieria sulphuraria]|uniref:Transducin family protein / WD-40 repeat family protein n=1 Tax=Galdieria sulphuraria TaxID=130081 RepID=M2Y8C5_GALSU|nr:transducin family protein / WD-40 repeat family protein [Galdieria sulphuraria]EME32313.1 transducin family protein / WD-40 repeat family protein [Galdieria sulphuraria]GJD07155.1 Probable catabolite repression protein creC [Galdieria sulphuraria]|eukprot:XP_005708833.1 transducin family protein / WD-40 repeat family protein [Galdieria sulphuraria]
MNDAFERKSVPSSPRKEPASFFKVPGEGKYENKQFFDSSVRQTTAATTSASKDPPNRENSSSSNTSRSSYYPYLRKVKLSLVTVPRESLTSTENPLKETAEESSLRRLGSTVSRTLSKSTFQDMELSTSQVESVVSGSDVSVAFVNYGTSLFAFRLQDNPENASCDKDDFTLMEKGSKDVKGGGDISSPTGSEGSDSGKDSRVVSTNSDPQLLRLFRFKDSITCHQAVCDDNNCVQVAVGFSKGEILIYFDVFSSKATSLVHNKDGLFNSSQVSAILWVPGSLTRLVTSHGDGGLLVWEARDGVDDKNSSNNSSGSSAQDGNSNIATETSLGTLPSSSSPTLHRSGTPKQEHNKSPKPATASSSTSNSKGLHTLTVTRPSRRKRLHPVSQWHFCGSPITDIAFSPDGSQLALTFKDGFLRICDFSREQILFSFQSYFGALLCVSWSPDGQYVATGGEDDLVSLWEPVTRQLICRMQAHTSFVSAIAFDYWLCHEGHYRLGSAGQDTKLILWDYPGLEPVHVKTQRGSRDSLKETSNGDFSFQEDSGLLRGRFADLEIDGQKSSRNILRAPLPLRLQQGQMGLSRSNSPLYSNPGRSPRTRTGSTFSKNSVTSNVSEPLAVIPARPRAKIPFIDPLLVHIAHSEPLTDMIFFKGGVLTASSSGLVKFWSRPTQATFTSMSSNDSASRPFFRVSMEIPQVAVDTE